MRYIRREDSMPLAPRLDTKTVKLHPMLAGTLRALSMLACTFRIYPKRNLVSVRWLRPATIKDWQEAVEQIVKDPLYRRGMNFITSRRGLTGVVNSDQIRQILSVLENGSGQIAPASVAIVASADYDFGMARMMEALSETALIIVRAFRTPRDAMKWLKNPIRFEYPAARLHRDCKFVGEQSLFRAWVAIT
jgi:hypothetical protein